MLDDSNGFAKNGILQPTIFVSARFKMLINKNSDVVHFVHVVRM
jgi:hypothetical protein